MLKERPIEGKLSGSHYTCGNCGNKFNVNEGRSICPHCKVDHSKYLNQYFAKLKPKEF